MSARTAGRTSKRCPRCGVTYKHPERHFHKAGDRADGLTANCKDCRRRDDAARHAANRDDPAYIERRRESKRKHLAKKRGVPYVPTDEREPVARPAPVTHTAMLDTLLAEVDRVLIAMKPQDETLQKFHRVTRAVWARIAPQTVKGA